MELVSVVRVLTRRWLLVTIGAVAAAAATYAGSQTVQIGQFGAAQVRSTTAFSQIQVDTPRPLVVDLDVDGDAIGTQAAVLATQLSDREATIALARSAGIPPRELTVVSADVQAPSRVSPISTSASTVAATPAGAYKMTVQTSADLPIITIEATGPSARTARRLAEGTATVVRSLATSDFTAVAGRRPPLEVRPLGSVILYDEKVTEGSNLLLSVLVFLVLLVMWCAAVVLATGLAREIRRLSRVAAARPLESRRQ